MWRYEEVIRQMPLMSFWGPLGFMKFRDQPNLGQRPVFLETDCKSHVKPSHHGSQSSASSIILSQYSETLLALDIFLLDKNVCN